MLPRYTDLAGHLDILINSLDLYFITFTIVMMVTSIQYTSRFTRASSLDSKVRTGDSVDIAL